MSKNARHRDSHVETWRSEMDDGVRGRDRDRHARSISRDRRRSSPASKRRHGESHRSPSRKKEYDMPPPPARRRSRGRSRSMENRRSPRRERSASPHRSRRRHRHDTSRSPHRRPSSSHRKRRHGSTSPPPKRRRSRSPGHSASKHSKRSRRRSRSTSRSSVRHGRVDTARSPRPHSPSRKYASHKSSHVRDRDRSLLRSPRPPPPLPRPQDLPPPPLSFRAGSPGSRRASPPSRRYSPVALERRTSRYPSPPSRRRTPPPPPLPPVPLSGMRDDHASYRRRSRSPYRGRDRSPPPPPPSQPSQRPRSAPQSPPSRARQSYADRSPITSPRPLKGGRSPPRRHPSEKGHNEYHVADQKTLTSPSKLDREKDGPGYTSDRDSGHSKHHHSPPPERIREFDNAEPSSRQQPTPEWRHSSYPDRSHDSGYIRGRGRGGRGRGRGRGGYDYFESNGYSQSYRQGPPNSREFPPSSRRGSTDSYGGQHSPRSRGTFHSEHRTNKYSPDRSASDRRGSGYVPAPKTRSSGRGMGRDQFFDLNPPDTEEKATKETVDKGKDSSDSQRKDSENRTIPTGPSQKSTSRDEIRELNDMPPPTRPRADNDSHSQPNAPSPFKKIGGTASSTQLADRGKNITFRPFTLNQKPPKPAKAPAQPRALDPVPQPSSATGSNNAPLGRERTFASHTQGPAKRDDQAQKATTKQPTPPPKVKQIIVKEGSIYHKVSMVGEGTYGKVYKASNNITNELVALKRIRMESERDGFPITAVREMRLLQALKQENIVSLLEMMVEKNDFYMVFEYMDHDLTGILNHPTFRLEPSHIKHLAKQFFQGMHYLHHRGVLHRDIKGSNILLNNEGQLKIADFGLARFYTKNSKKKLDYTNRIITLWYRPPEILLGATAYGPAVDMWSAACVFIELFARSPIFQGRTEIDQLDTIYNVMGRPTERVWPELKRMPWYLLLKTSGHNRHSKFRFKYEDLLPPSALDLAEQLLQYDPDKRPTAEQCLEHAYFLEDPQPEAPLGLRDLKGDWHEYESKIERRKERDNDKRRRADAERKKAAERKRQGQQAYDPAGPVAPSSGDASSAIKRKWEGSSEAAESKKREVA